MIPLPLMFVLLLTGFWLLYRIPDCTQRSTHSPSDLAAISVIIPARNEELRIPPLLASLQKQSKPPGEIIVVDDHSTDQTAQLAATAGCTVLTSAPLPPGWQGKSWACWQGAQLAQHPVILFLDADTCLADDGLARIAAEFRKDYSPLSIQPYHSMKTLIENFSAYFNLVLMMGTYSFTPLGRQIKPRAFFGPCQIMQRSDYLQTGGHSSTRSAVLDDVALGQHFIQAGISIRNISGRDAICFRMYPHGINDMIQGWSKNFAIGSQSIGWFPLLLISLWIWGSVALSVHCICAVLQPDAFFTPALPALYILASLQLASMLRYVGNFSPLTWLLFPLPLFFFILIFFRAAFFAFFIRKVTWKGRTLSTRRGL